MYYVFNKKVELADGSQLYYKPPYYVIDMLFGAHFIENFVKFNTFILFQNMNAQINAGPRMYNSNNC